MTNHNFHSFYATRPLQVGDSITSDAFKAEQMVPVRATNSNPNIGSARFIKMMHDGSVVRQTWGSALILAEVGMYRSCREEDYVVTSQVYTDKSPVVLARGSAYEVSLFIARRARAFGYALYATDVPLEV